MLDLSNIRAVLFDFDDTLCVHTKRPLSSVLTREDQADRILSGGEPWTCGVSPDIMQRFVALCQTKQKHMGLISSTDSYIRAEAKVLWVLKHYGVRMENYCVGPSTPKVEMLKSVARHLGACPEQVMLVDDLYSNLDEAAMSGFIACSPMECVYYMEHLESKGGKRSWV